MIILRGQSCPKAGACRFPCIARQPIEIEDFECTVHEKKNGRKLPMMDNSYNLTEIWHEQSTVY